MATKTTTTKTTKTGAKKTSAKNAPAKKTSTKPDATARPSRGTNAKSTTQPKPIPRDHEVPSPKELANNANLDAHIDAKKNATAKFTKSTPRQAAPKASPTPKRPSGLDLAAKALADASEPLNAKTIAERAIAAGWATKGKTPHATLYAAMTREIATKGETSRFRKVERGMFIAATPAR